MSFRVIYEMGIISQTIELPKQTGQRFGMPEDRVSENYSENVTTATLTTSQQPLLTVSNRVNHAGQHFPAFPGLSNKHNSSLTIT